MKKISARIKLNLGRAGMIVIVLLLMKAFIDSIVTGEFSLPRLFQGEYQVKENILLYIFFLLATILPSLCLILIFICSFRENKCLWRGMNKQNYSARELSFDKNDPKIRKEK